MDASPEGDAWFPAWDRAAWVESARDPHDGFAFVTYERVDRGGHEPGARVEPGRLRRLDRAAGAVVGRLLPRWSSGPGAAVLGVGVGVLLGAAGLLLAVLLLGALLWLPLAWGALGAVLVLGALGTGLRTARRRAPGS